MSLANGIDLVIIMVAVTTGIVYTLQVDDSDQQYGTNTSGLTA